MNCAHMEQNDEKASVEHEREGRPGDFQNSDHGPLCLFEYADSNYKQVGV